MDVFYSYMILIMLLLARDSKCQNVEDEHTNTTDRGNTTANPLVTSSDYLVTTPDYSVAIENRTSIIVRNTTYSSNVTSAETDYTDDLESECDECLARLQKLVDDRRNNETDIKYKTGNYCLESTAGRNELINCVTNSKAGCPGNGTILHEIQQDLDEICQTDCSIYKTIIAKLDFCWTNFTQVKALETSGDYTEFCRVWREHDLCINSITKHCGEEMNKLALEKVIERYEDEQSYIRLKDNAGYVCNTECGELRLTHILQNASSCIQFISEKLHRGDNQMETIFKCRDWDLCEFEEPLDEDVCPSPLKLVSKVDPNYLNILKTFRKLCLADVSGKSMKMNVTIQDRQGIVGLAAISNDFTKRQHNETSTQIIYKAAEVITDVISTNVSVETSSAYNETTSPIPSDETSFTTVTSEPITSTSANPITTVLQKITKLPGKWLANGWVPCSVKEQAEVSGSTSNTNNLKANYIRTWFTVLLLYMLKW